MLVPVSGVCYVAVFVMQVVVMVIVLYRLVTTVLPVCVPMLGVLSVLSRLGAFVPVPAMIPMGMPVVEVVEVVAVGCARVTTRWVVPVVMLLMGRMVGRLGHRVPLSSACRIMSSTMCPTCWPAKMHCNVLAVPNHLRRLTR
jgi:hypothetical protein